MGVACDVYTKLLFKRGHGHPLWEPEPTQSGEVLIGDVGYMLDGGFYRLFNATLPADHPLHERHGVPDGYEPLAFPDTLRHHRPHALEAGSICSKSVTAVNADATVEAGTGTFGPLAHVRFKFSDEQGAVLVLKNDAHREVLHPCRDLTQYILLNHAGWHQFARNVCRLDLKSQDIIFVCGWVKTAEWALAAATHRARDGEIAFGGDFGPAGQASFSVSATQEVSMSWEHRRGPKNAQGEEGKTSKFDQCVFLHYFKVKHRPFFVPKVLRGATEESHSSRSSTPDGSDHMASVDDEGAISKDVSFESARAQVEVVPRPSEQGDMVDTVLDYILDQTDATCAIACDRDIVMLSSHQTQGDIQDSVSQLLADTRPNLTVTGGVGMLSCHNAPVDGATNEHSVPPTLRPMVQFLAGPPRVLPHYRTWSRNRRSRSRSHSVTRALSPPSVLLPPRLSPQLSPSTERYFPVRFGLPHGTPRPVPNGERLFEVPPAGAPMSADLVRTGPASTRHAAAVQPSRPRLIRDRDRDRDRDREISQDSLSPQTWGLLKRPTPRSSPSKGEVPSEQDQGDRVEGGSQFLTNILPNAVFPMTPPLSAALAAGEVQPWSARRDSAFAPPPWGRGPEMCLSFPPLGAGVALPQPEGAPLPFLDARTVESASSQPTEGPSSDHLGEDLLPQRSRKRGRPPKMESVGTPAVQSKGKGPARGPSEDGALSVEEDDERPAKRSRRQLK